MAALKVARIEATKPTRKTTRKHQSMIARLTPAHKVACGCGCVGAGMLALSMVDCTHALIHLGMHWCLAPLMAAGIDAGLVASECADMVTHNHPHTRARIYWWMIAYMVIAIIASIMLNCLGAWEAAPVQSRIIATVFAGMVPCMVAIMFRIMGGLMSE